MLCVHIRLYIGKENLRRYHFYADYHRLAQDRLLPSRNQAHRLGNYKSACIMNYAHQNSKKKIQTCQTIGVTHESVRNVFIIAVLMILALMGTAAPGDCRSGDCKISDSSVLQSTLLSSVSSSSSTSSVSSSVSSETPRRTSLTSALRTSLSTCTTAERKCQEQTAVTRDSPDNPIDGVVVKRAPDNVLDSLLDVLRSVVPSHTQTFFLFWIFFSFMGHDMRGLAFV
jgi:hypothetical protein